MPQFDPTVFSPQLVWLAITFVVLYVLMARIALPRIGEVLESRQDKIAHDLDAAQTLKAEADAVLAEYEKAIAEARAKAQALLAEAAEERAREAEARIKGLDERLAKELADAEARIAKAKAEALASLDTLAVEIAQSAAERLVGAPVDTDVVRTAVAAAAREGR